MLLPHAWNNGMMEYWNVDFNNEVPHLRTFLASMSRAIFQIAHFYISPEPSIPNFQYSNIPIAASGL